MLTPFSVSFGSIIPQLHGFFKRYMQKNHRIILWDNAVMIYGEMILYLSLSLFCNVHSASEDKRKTERKSDRYKILEKIGNANQHYA